MASQDCSVARALSVVGDRWTMLIIREAFTGHRRFDQLLDSGASRTILADRLKLLVEHEVLTRELYSSHPDRYEYRLTDKGRDLYPVLLALLGWGDRWMAGDDGPPLTVRHKPCGHVTTGSMTCTGCGEILDARAVELATEQLRTG